MTVEEMLGEHVGSPKLNLPTLDWWREMSLMACSVNGTVSHPNRRLGIATLVQRDIAKSTMSGPSLDILMQAPLYLLANAVALFIMAFPDLDGLKQVSTPRYLNWMTFSRQPMISSP